MPDALRLMPEWTNCPNQCGRHARTGHLMCAGCWRAVPRDLQRDVYRTWRAYQTVKINDTDAFEVASAAYRDARDAALASLHGVIV